VSSRSSNNPPSFPGYHRVGWIKSAHGIRGELYIQLYAGQADWLDGLESIFFLNDELKEWRVLAAKPHKEGLILSVEGCADRNMAESLRGRAVYILEDLLVAEDGEEIFLHQILDFTVCDADGRRIGVIRGFATNGAQDLLRVEREGGAGEALIPFVDDFIVRLDFDKRELLMELPDGLLDVE
jgi:16S rRNA processing protein RimM